MDKARLTAGLVDIVGREDVLFARRDLLVYSYDAEARGQYPDAAVFPADAAEVSAIMKLARELGVPVIPRGAGTNLSGGTLAVNGGIVLECARMNRILSIDAENRRTVVEPGVINLDLQNALGRVGYTYGPDPASQKVSTLGGNVGENAGGPHCLKYGVTSNHVVGMEVVLADGRIVELGGAVEDLPVYDLLGLQVGAEGTLGFITRLTLRILRQSESVRTLLAIFDRLEDAGAAVSAIVAAGIIPATLEIMDQAVIRAVEGTRSFGFPLDAQAVLLIEVDGIADGLDRQVDEIVAMCRQSRAREVRLARTGAERDALWAGRRGAFGAIARVKPSYIVHDGTVPRTILAETLAKVLEIGTRYNVAIANVAHAGDGNLHPLFMFDSRDAEETGRVRRAAEEILTMCLDLGGTLTGEHGIGVTKQKAMNLQFSPPALGVMAAIKRTFDPMETVNPGKIFPGQLPILYFPPARASSDRSELTSQLGKAAALGDLEMIGEDAALQRYRVGELRVMAVARPANADGVVRAVKAAASAGVPVVPWGRGTRQDVLPRRTVLQPCVVLRPKDAAGSFSEGPKDVGGQSSVECLVVDLGRMSAVEELDQGNQTIRVQAGAVLADVQAALAPHRLFLPLDPDDGATIGDVVAWGLSGPRRFGYGTPRDLVLGLRVVLATGDCIRVGGKTMKDVAGYDLRRLFVGSRGTLGIIVEAILRLYPLPESRSAVAARFAAPAQASAAVRAILGSQLTPVAIEMLNRPVWGTEEAQTLISVGESDVLLLLGIEARREAAERQERDLTHIARAQGASATATLRGADADRLWEERHRAVAARGASAVRAKISVPIARVGELFERAGEIGQPGARIGLSAHAGTGVSYAFCSPDGHLVALRSLREWAAEVGGFLAIERGPTAALQEMSAIPSRGEYGLSILPRKDNLMAQLKAALDPGNLFNPGQTPQEAAR